MAPVVPRPAVEFCAALRTHCEAAPCSVFATANSAAWRAHRESNPAYQDENLVS